MKNGIWYRNGLHFSCLRCGKCCWDEGPYTEVYIDRDDILKMAAYLNLYPDEFHRRYVTRSDEYAVLRSDRGACVMLRDASCGVYPVRPRQCRTWPFWPENLNRRTWYGEVRKRCPGAGQGRRYTPEEIEAIWLSGSPVS
ncbi:MAG: YkgJ family cysteine cluster protein [bacterium]